MEKNNPTDFFKRKVFESKSKNKKSEIVIEFISSIVVFLLQTLIIWYSIEILSGYINSDKFSIPEISYLDTLIFFMTLNILIGKLSKLFRK